MPGFNTKAPFVTTVYQIVVRPETDTMEPITSVTKDGITNTFHDVQVIQSSKKIISLKHKNSYSNHFLKVISHVPQEKVVPLIRKYGMEFKNALVFDRIAEELKTFCAGKATFESTF